MSRQRSSSQSTSGRSSQASSSTKSSATTGASTGTQGEFQGGGLGSGQTGGAMEQAKEKTQQLAGQVQQKATQRVESGLVRGKSQAAETLNVVAQSLLTTGQQLRERNQEPVSRFIDQTADRVQRVSNYLVNTDVSEMIDRTEEFARRRPALFIGGAFAIGLLGARFFKSSRRQQDRIGTVGFTGSGTGQGYSRDRSMTSDQEVSTPVAGREWAAGSANVSGFADVGGTGFESGQQSLSDFGRQRGPLDYGLPPGGPEAPQR